MISEVHPNAVAVGTSAESNEWIEIHNLEPYPVNLAGWTIEDAQAIAPLPDYVLPEGETVVVAGSAVDMSVPAGKALIILETRAIGTGLRNAGDRVALVNPYGVRHDAVSWGDVRWPRFSEPPDPHQSIIRTSAGGQSVSDRLTPWTVGEAISVAPARHRHARPDTSVRIIKALIDPAGDEPETVTIRNTSDQPLITVNWTLTVNNSRITLRSVRIEPGASFDIQARNGSLGAGLSGKGGHLVLRDSRGNWLSTASWGNDRSFHRMASPAAGQELRFNPLVRIHPRVPWFDLDHNNTRMVSTGGGPEALQGSHIAARVLREPAATTVAQDSPDIVVWISEVYPNAGQGRNDPAFEWFELTNSSDLAAPLDGWSIADNTSSDTLDGVIVPAHSSVVIAGSGQAVPGVAIALSDGRIGNGLANSGDHLRLIDPAGEVVDAISWGDDNSHSAIKSPKQDESLHRESPNDNPFLGRPSPGTLTHAPVAAPTVSAADERSEPVARSNDQQSVGTDQTAGSIVTPDSEPGPTLMITEILPSPLPGQPEWVEIHNPTTHSISLDGWTIGDHARRTELAGTISAGTYVVITTQPLDTDVIAIVVERIGNGLNNDADAISIFTPDGRPVDEIHYGREALPAPERGLSIALDPERWVVTAEPSPGTADVTPLLGDAFRSASTRTPISDEDRLPIVPAEDSEGVNAWMIVSVALIGVILTLVVRRVQPVEAEPDPDSEPALNAGPATETPPTQDSENRNGSTGP